MQKDFPIIGELSRFYKKHYTGFYDTLLNFGFYCITAWGMTVGMNLEYSLHQQGPALVDVGFQLFPEMDDHLTTEIMLHVVLILTPIFAFCNWSWPSSLRTISPRWDLFAAFTRCMSVLNVLRTMTFLCTQLPGPAKHCRPDSDVYNPPTHMTERAVFDKGCGDLLFSGHMMMLASLNMVWQEGYNGPYRMVVKSLFWAYEVLFGVLVIASRKHYTVDILLAMYVAPLVWNRFRTGWNVFRVYSAPVAAELAARQDMAAAADAPRSGGGDDAADDDAAAPVEEKIRVRAAAAARRALAQQVVHPHAAMLVLAAAAGLWFHLLN